MRKKFFFVLFYLHFCFAQESGIIEINHLTTMKFEHVDFSRIEKLIQKYDREYSKAKWKERLKYIGIGFCSASVGLWLGKQFFLDDSKAKGSDGVSQDRLGDGGEWKIKKLAQKVDILDQIKKEREYKRTFKYIGDKALKFVLFTVITTAILNLVQRIGNLIKENFDEVNDAQDNVDFYKFKNMRIQDLIQKIGLFLFKSKQNLQDNFENDFLKLSFSDVLIDQVLLVRWFEDLVAFVKHTALLRVEKNSYEIECLDKDILILVANLDDFADKISLIKDSQIDKFDDLLEELILAYMLFYRNFSNFIYDYGFFLYDEAFLPQ